MNIRKTPPWPSRANSTSTSSNPSASIGGSKRRIKASRIRSTHDLKQKRGPSAPSLQRKAPSGAGSTQARSRQNLGSPPRGAIIGKADLGVNPDRANPNFKTTGAASLRPQISLDTKKRLTSASDRAIHHHRHHHRRCAPEPHSPSALARRHR